MPEHMPPTVPPPPPDPFYNVVGIGPQFDACPVCGAAPGQPCTDESGASGWVGDDWFVHEERKAGSPKPPSPPRSTCGFRDPGGGAA